MGISRCILDCSHVNPANSLTRNEPFNHLSFITAGGFHEPFNADSSGQ